MLSLETRLGRAVFRNPVFGASGCTGHGYELAGYTDLSRFGAVSLKTFFNVIGPAGVIAAVRTFQNIHPGVHHSTDFSDSTIGIARSLDFIT